MTICHFSHNTLNRLFQSVLDTYSHWPVTPWIWKRYVLKKILRNRYIGLFTSGATSFRRLHHLVKNFFERNSLWIFNTFLIGTNWKSSLIEWNLNTNLARNWLWRDFPEQKTVRNGRFWTFPQGHSIWHLMGKVFTEGYGKTARKNPPLEGV